MATYGPVIKYLLQGGGGYSTLVKILFKASIEKE